MQFRDECVVVVLFIFLQFFFQKQFSLFFEGFWFFNNFIVNSFSFCIFLFFLDLIEFFLQLLLVFNVVSVMVFIVLCNVVEKGFVYCQWLWLGFLFFVLLYILVFFDIEVVGQSLELLYLLFLYQLEVVQVFLQQLGLQVLERYQEEVQFQDCVYVFQQIVF